MIAAARESFAKDGYEATSTDAILGRAGVSKGALYHHFASKAELLAAVFETVSHELMARAQAAAGTGPVRAVLVSALKAWLRAVLEPDVRAIVLDAGPAVLGMMKARSIEETITQAPMRRAIEQAVANGEVRCEDSDLAARLLAAVVTELALTATQRELAPDHVDRLDASIDAVVGALL